MISHLLDTNACIALINGKPLGVRRKLEEVIAAGGVEKFTGEDAAYAGALRAKLEASGTVIGAYDTLIAAQASRLNCIVVTANTREFKRVGGLAVEDWTRK